MMRIEAGPLSYDWVDCWAALPDPELARDGWAHPGIQVTDTGEVVTFHPSEPKVLVLDRAGALVREWTVPLTEGHGLTLTGDRLWIADPGSKMRRASDGSYQPFSGGPRVVQFTLDGRITAQLEQPPLDEYAEGTYAPTDTAVDTASGDVWIADGYGQSLVHRFDGDGRYISSISGTEGGGRFNCPHSVLIIGSELYIADRGNARIQVYGLDGSFHRVVGADFLNSPSVFAVDGDQLIVGELFGRLTVLDRNDQFVAYVGDGGAVQESPGWPNAQDDAGLPVSPAHLHPGAFNSPHGLASDPDGNLYVAEWLIGGRYTKLTKLGA
jgi:DNA-binding beta-propeller fold protein YncE